MGIAKDTRKGVGNRRECRGKAGEQLEMEKVLENTVRDTPRPNQLYNDCKTSYSILVSIFLFINI